MIRTIAAALVTALAAAATCGPARAQQNPFANYVSIDIEGRNRGSQEFTNLIPKLLWVSSTEVIAPFTQGYNFGDATGAAVYAHVVPGFSQFAGMAVSPFPVDNPQQGSRATIEVSRTYVKINENASLKYTYSAGLLQIKDLLPQKGLPCAASLDCMYAEVKAFAAVGVGPVFDTIWEESMEAKLYRGADLELKTSIGSSGSSSPGGGLRNPDWAWTPNLGETEGSLELDSPYTASFDLSGVEVGTLFKVDFGMIVTAVNVDVAGQAFAYAADPVTGNPGEGFGFGLIESGLAPVPEPASWLLISAGLFAVSSTVRRGRARQQALA